MKYDPLDDFSTSEFTHGGTTRTVYRKGAGPAVIVIHEVPGITPMVARFCRWVVDAGFTVFAPSLLGTPGRPPTVPYVMASLKQACIAREFHVLARHRSSPITAWLRALARDAHEALGGPGVGAIGMCLTGNFALSMVLEPAVIAPVLSQPSLPLGPWRRQREAVHASPEELEAVQRRGREEGLCVLGLRFTRDPTCTGERFDTLRAALGAHFEAIEIDSRSVPRSRFPSGPHSVVTEDLVDEEGHPTIIARDRVLSFFTERLKPAAE